MRKHIVYSFLASLLLIPSAMPVARAQTGEGQISDDGLTGERILAGRDLYLDHNDSERDSVLHLRDDNVARDVGDTRTFSELAQNRTGPAVPRQVRYPRGRSYGGTWRRQRGNGRHALIGALIGFGIGAALGAKGNQDQNTRARISAPILFGGVGALIGAAVGASHP